MADTRRFPTVRQYFDWAMAEGCTVECTRVEGGGQLALLTAPDGHHVYEVFAEDTDALVSSNVARLDRRLGLKSYLFV